MCELTLIQAEQKIKGTTDPQLQHGLYRISITDFVSYCLSTQHFPAQQAELGICTAGNMQPLLRVVSPLVLTGAYKPWETVQGAMRKTQCLATTAKLQSPAVRDIMLQSQGVQNEPTFSKERDALGMLLCEGRTLGTEARGRKRGNILLCGVLQYSNNLPRHRHRIL